MAPIPFSSDIILIVGKLQEEQLRESPNESTNKEESAEIINKYDSMIQTLQEEQKVELKKGQVSAKTYIFINKHFYTDQLRRHINQN